MNKNAITVVPLFPEQHVEAVGGEVVKISGVFTLWLAAFIDLLRRQGEAVSANAQFRILPEDRYFLALVDGTAVCFFRMIERWDSSAEWVFHTGGPCPDADKSTRSEAAESLVAVIEKMAQDRNISVCWAM